MTTIRAFIAIDLPEAARAALGEASQTVAAQLPERSVRWVRPERMHLTLRFLGDTAVAKLPAIADAIDGLAAHHAPFEMALGGLGCFPNRKRPRVIWAGLDGNPAPLLALKQGLDAVLEPLGWPREDRPFRPHLTIGRVKDGRRLRGIAWGAEVERVVVPVTAVVLIESELTRSGPIYTQKHAGQLSNQ